MGGHLHASAVARDGDETVTVDHDSTTFEFSRQEIDEIVDARLEEIFEAVHKELKRAGRAGQLPSGVVLTGGSANLKGIVDYTKQSLGLAARVGAAKGYGGVAEHLDEPQFAVAVGLMLTDAEGTPGVHNTPRGGGHASGAAKSAAKQASGLLSNILGRFKA